MISNLGSTDTVVLWEVANSQPITNARGDQQVTDSDGNGTETVTLDGSGSFDTDGTIQSYGWKEGGNVLGSSAILVPESSLDTHTVSLTVTDDKGAWASDNALVKILSAGELDFVKSFV